MRPLPLLVLALAGCGPAGSVHEPHEHVRGALLAEDRPTSPSASLPRFDPSEQVESVVSPGGRFRVHFTRVGPNSVPGSDADGNGVPDAVDTVAQTYDRVAAFYAGLGYLAPPSDAGLPGDTGGDGLFDVYLVDFAGRADGAFRLEACQGAESSCAGYMLQENDFAGYSYSSFAEAVDTLASHEFFHAVQAAYRPNLGTVALEGTAVWATERFSPPLEDLEHFSSAYLDRPDRSLVVDTGGPSSFSYGASLFFQFLSERFEDRVILSMWQESVRAPTAGWAVLLDTALRSGWSADFDSAFTEFASWNMATGSRASPGQGYAQGGGYGEISPAPVSLPVEMPSVRLAPASARYFELSGGAQNLSVGFLPQDEAGATGLHLLVAVVGNDAKLEVTRVDGPGPLLAQVSAPSATRVLVALVDGRHEGTGRYGRLCISDAATGSPCPSDTPPKDEDKGCHAAPGGLTWALSWMSLSLWLHRRARKKLPER
ncbi:MAG TPA: MXAN_6640 family putative metalloprotease [Hyalangium sp.]|nr:MXAN_6640 family putative metalloprotease [Hyalangium sp.]